MFIIFKCFPHTISCNPLKTLISPPLCVPSALPSPHWLVLWSLNLPLGSYSLVCCNFYTPHIRDTINYLYFSVLLISLMFSKFLHVVAKKTSFFFMAEQYSIVCVCVYIYVYIYDISFIHLSCDGYFGFFNALAIVTSAAVSLETCVFLFVLFSAKKPPHLFQPLSKNVTNIKNVQSLALDADLQPHRQVRRERLEVQSSSHSWRKGKPR